MTSATTEVFRCQQSGLGHCNQRGWHIQTHHETGLPWAEEHCPLYRTRREALAVAQEKASEARDFAAWLDEQDARIIAHAATLDPFKCASPVGRKDLWR